MRRLYILFVYVFTCSRLKVQGYKLSAHYDIGLNLIFIVSINLTLFELKFQRLSILGVAKLQIPKNKSQIKQNKCFG